MIDHRIEFQRTLVFYTSTQSWFVIEQDILESSENYKSFFYFWVLMSTLLDSLISFEKNFSPFKVLQKIQIFGSKLFVIWFDQFLLTNNIWLFHSVKYLVFIHTLHHVKLNATNFKKVRRKLTLSFLGVFWSLRHKWCISSTVEFLEIFVKLGCRGHWCDQI